MAGNTKKTTNTSSDKKTTAKTSASTRAKNKAAAKKAEINRAWSIVMFAVGVLIFFITIVPGENFWEFIRKEFVYGVFGSTSIVVSFLLIYLGVLTASNRPIKIKMIEAVFLVLIVSSVIQLIFNPNIIEGNFFDAISSLHLDGKENLISGGAISAILAAPLMAALGKVPSIITLFILALVLFMFFADINLYDLFNKTAKTAKEQKEELAKELEENRKIKAEKQAQKQAKLEEKRKIEAENAAIKKSAVIDFEIDEKPSTDVFSEETSKNVISDNVKLIKEKEKTATPIPKASDVISPEIMKRFQFQDSLKLDENTPEFKQAVLIEETKQAVVENPTLTEMEKKANTLTKEEKEAIRPLSEENPQSFEAPKAYIYSHPPVSLFDKDTTVQGNIEGELKTNAQLLIDTLSSFGVQAKIIDISRGPSVTRYELQPLAGVKISKITNLADDIALNLAASGVRIEAPIPNKAAVGIEVPNKKNSPVNIRTVFESKNFMDSESPLTIALGVDIAGNEIITDLTKMPHMLIAGSTGSGKSVCINGIIMSFLHKSSPEDVKLILIDPKIVELQEYNGIPHLLMPVVTEPKKAAGALGSAVAEMEKRYRLFAENTVRDIKSFNNLAKTNEELEHMPYIAVIIDELADLMMTSGKEVEDYICRLAQKARAAGIHLIVATQRPSVDVITGLIKTNIPARIAFAVSSQIDSRTVLDSGGAEKLLGMGDMLFLPIGASKPTRVQGTYVKDREIAEVIKFIKKDFNPSYSQSMIEEMEKMTPKDKKASSNDETGVPQDEMLEAAIEVVVDLGQASTSLLQRKLRLGYSRAARIIDEMEEMGIIGQSEGSKPRQVLLSKNQWLERKLSSSDEN